MRSLSKPYPSLDEQILACIEPAKISDEGAKLDDFQLRMAGKDLVLFNLKTSKSFALYDTDNESLDHVPEDLPLVAARPLQTTVRVARSGAAGAKRSAHRLFGWFASHHISLFPPTR